MRSTDIDQCRNSAKSSDAFETTRQKYDFNRQGQLMKRTVFRGETKEITIYGYNGQGLISGFEIGERTTVFQYDTTGRLVRTEGRSGAAADIVRDFRYHGDTTIVHTTDLISGQVESLLEVRDLRGNITYRALKTPTHDTSEVDMQYDSLGRVEMIRSNLGLYQEFEYDKYSRVVRTYVGATCGFMSDIDYDDDTGMSRTSRWELVNGEYVRRNEECCCRIKDGQNNLIKCEWIDCSSTESGELYGLRNFSEVSYEYFKPSKVIDMFSGDK